MPKKKAAKPKRKAKKTTRKKTRSKPISAEAERVLRSVLRQHHRKGLEKPLVGLACYCCYGEGEFRVYVCDETGTTKRHPDDWHPDGTWTCVYGCGAARPKRPAWTQEFDRLLDARNNNLIGAKITKEALGIILANVAVAVAGLAQSGGLQSLGFVEKPKLIVYTDDGFSAGAKRVKNAKRLSRSKMPIDFGHLLP